MTAIVIDEGVEERVYTRRLDVHTDDLLAALSEAQAYVSRASYTTHETVLLCGESFLVSIDIAPAPAEELTTRHERSLDDFLTDAAESDETPMSATDVYIHPYPDSPSTDAQGDRNRQDECDTCIQYVTTVAADVP